MNRRRVALLVILTSLVAYWLYQASPDRPARAQSGSPFGAVTPVPLIISEFRLRGANGPTDEFVEIYNNSDFAHTVNSIDGSASGYALAGSSNAVINDNLVATRFVIPNGTVHPNANAGSLPK